MSCQNRRGGNEALPKSGSKIYFLWRRLIQLKCTDALKFHIGRVSTYLHLPVLSYVITFGKMCFISIFVYQWKDLNLSTRECHNPSLPFWGCFTPLNTYPLTQKTNPVGARRKAEMKEGGALIIICYNKPV